jgi:hypothetical protein
MNDAKRCKSLNRNVADGKRQSESLKSCADNCRPSERRENRLRRSKRNRREQGHGPLRQDRRSPHGAGGGVECSVGNTPGGQPVREAVCRILLEPDGSLLGELARRGSKVRRVYGGQKEAEELFGRLAKLGRDSRIETYPGKRVELPGCGYAGYREASKSGEPTVDVDVNIEAIGNVKFKFVGSAGP